MFNIKVISVDKNGIATCSYDYDAQFLEFYKSETGKQEIVDLEISQFIEDYLHKQFDGITPKETTLKNNRN